MELKECITCGSHSFTGNKCDYCGNEYEVTDYYTDDKHDMTLYGKREIFYSNDFLTIPEQEKQQATYEEDDYLEYKAQELTEQNKKVLKIMVWILISIIWFAVTVFIPPLFLITICGLIIWVCRKICKKY